MTLRLEKSDILRSFLRYNIMCGGRKFGVFYVCKKNDIGIYQKNGVFFCILYVSDEIFSFQGLSEYSFFFLFYPKNMDSCVHEWNHF